MERAVCGQTDWRTESSHCLSQELWIKGKYDHAKMMRLNFFKNMYDSRLDMLFKALFQKLQV